MYGVALREVIVFSEDLNPVFKRSYVSESVVADSELFLKAASEFFRANEASMTLEFGDMAFFFRRRGNNATLVVSDQGDIAAKTLLEHVDKYVTWRFEKNELGIDEARRLVDRLVVAVYGVSEYVRLLLNGKKMRLDAYVVRGAIAARVYEGLGARVDPRRPCSSEYLEAVKPLGGGVYDVYVCHQAFEDICIVYVCKRLLVSTVLDVFETILFDYPRRLVADEEFSALYRNLVRVYKAYYGREYLPHLLYDVDRFLRKGLEIEDALIELAEAYGVKT